VLVPLLLATTILVQIVEPLPTINLQEVVLPAGTISVAFQGNRIYAFNSSRYVFYTTDMGTTSPTWVTLGAYPSGYGLASRQPLVTSDNKYVYGRFAYYPPTPDYYGLMRLSLTTMTLDNVTINGVVDVVDPEHLFLSIVETDGKIYVSNYYGSGKDFIAYGDSGTTTFTVFYNFTAGERIGDLHSIFYSSISDRLYFTGDFGWGYFQNPSLGNSSIMWGLRITDYSQKRLGVYEYNVNGHTEIAVGYDASSASPLPSPGFERYNIDRDLLKQYNYTGIKTALAPLVGCEVWGDKLFQGYTRGAQSFGGMVVQNLFDGSYNWVITNQTSTDQAVTTLDKIGDYIYFFGRFGGTWKLYMINLSAIPKYDYLYNGIEIKYLDKGNLTAASYSNRQLKMVLDAPRTVSIEVYCGWHGIPRRIIVDEKAYTHPEASLADFNSAPYTTWYWDDATSTLHIKVAPLSPTSVIVEWLEAPVEAPPPPPPEPKPEVPPTIIEQIRETVQTALTFLVELSPATKILLTITVIVTILILYKRLRG